MMRTATDFSLQVRRCEKAIRAAHTASAELLTTTKNVMSLPLPQTYEDTAASVGAAAAAATCVGGPHFKADALSRVGNESGHKLETEVLAPLTRWQDVHLQLAVSERRKERSGGWGCVGRWRGLAGSALPLAQSLLLCRPLPPPPSHRHGSKSWRTRGWSWTRAAAPCLTCPTSAGAAAPVAPAAAPAAAPPRPAAPRPAAPHAARLARSTARCAALLAAPDPAPRPTRRRHQCRVSSMRSKLGTSGGGAKTEQKLDSTIRILSHKEAKLKGGWGGRGCRMHGQQAARAAQQPAAAHGRRCRVPLMPARPRPCALCPRSHQPEL